MITQLELFNLLKSQISKENFDGLKILIDENYELKEALKSSRGKLCKNCPYR